MLIGIHSYYSRAGKDTAADTIVEWAEAQGIQVEKFAFADQMKVVAARALGIENPEDVPRSVDFMNRVKFEHLIVPAEDCDGTIDIAGRDFLIDLAEGIRALDPMFWVRHLFSDPSGGPHMDEGEIHEMAAMMNYMAIVTDVRFLPEADWLTSKCGGTLITIDRPNGGEHHNEDKLPFGMARYQIQNTGTLDQFKIDVRTTIYDVINDAVSGR